MSYFPAFLKLDNKKILIVGGGKIAADKISHILDFTNDITIISPKIDERVKNFIDDFNLKYIKREYIKGDINEFFLVIVAADDISLQKEIYKECQDKKILCNSVDSVDYCDFIFPSYIKKGDLIIAFSTSGSSPSLAKYLRRAIENLLPKNIDIFLNELKDIRKRLPKGKKRQEILEKKAKEYIDRFFKKDENV